MLEETLAILSDLEAMRPLAAAELADDLGKSETELAAAMERRGRLPVA